MTRHLWKLGLVPLAIACAVAAHAGRWRSHPPEAAPRARITVGLQIVLAEVADTQARKQRGLSGRTSLPAGHGMWFPYEVPGRLSFWMKGMLLPLDFVWVDDGVIVDLTENVPPEGGASTLVRPRVPASGALEVPAGTIARWGWKVGDPVHVTPLPAERP